MQSSVSTTEKTENDSMYVMLHKFQKLPKIDKHVLRVDVSWNELRTIEIPDHLIHLNAGYNMLKEIRWTCQSKSQLQHLNLDVNHIVRIDSLPEDLEHLSCRSNLIRYPPILPSKLRHLAISGNPLLHCPKLPYCLTYLDINTACLTSLPELPMTLISLFCSHNFLTSLPELPPNLVHLYCSSNCLSSVPEFPQSLQVIDVAYNIHLTKLPTLPHRLEKLYVNDTRIKELPKLPLTLFTLNSLNNPELIYVYSFRRYRKLCPYRVSFLAATIIARKYLEHYKRRLDAAKKIKLALHNWLWKPPHALNAKIGYRLCIEAIENSSKYN